MRLLRSTVQHSYKSFGHLSGDTGFAVTPLLKMFFDTLTVIFDRRTGLTRNSSDVCRTDVEVLSESRSGRVVLVYVRVLETFVTFYYLQTTKFYDSKPHKMITGGNKEIILPLLLSRTFPHNTPNFILLHISDEETFREKFNVTTNF